MNLEKIRNNDGFTLVELAIVITIIGILIGGVLKGQQLIDQARLAGTIAQVRDYKSAVMIFQTKYDALPGDMLNPDERIVGCMNCAAQDAVLGNGLIGGGGLGVSSTSGWDVTNEPIRFWLHLYKADMISGVTDAALTQSNNAIGETIPATKMGYGFYAESGNGSCGAGESQQAFGGCLPIGLTLVITPITKGSQDGLGDNNRYFKISEVAQIDRKMDDGRPLSGNVRGISRGGGAPGLGCAAGDPKVYPESFSNADFCTVGFIIAD